MSDECGVVITDDGESYFAAKPDHLIQLADERYSHHSKEKSIQVSHLFWGVTGGRLNTDMDFKRADIYRFTSIYPFPVVLFNGLMDN